MIGSTAKVYAARVLTEDPPQNPFGDQTKPLFLDMLPNDESGDEQETFNIEVLQPKAIVIDDYDVAQEVQVARTTRARCVDVSRCDPKS